MLKSKLNNKKLIVGSYVCLFLFLELFHSFIGMYFDDYGNASLSYGYHADVLGMNWTLEDLGQWAHWIYFNFSGRIMCGSILNLLFKIGGGQHLFMAIQAGILTLMFYMMYRLVMYYTGQKDNVMWSRMKAVVVSDASASSEATSTSGKNFSAENVINSDLSSVWGEGVDGAGIGEKLTLNIGELKGTSENKNANYYDEEQIKKTDETDELCHKYV
ncbi:MAG: hypothetical protein EGQ63_08290, partial [Clostridiales bacterium]|nr:hypothetical protein [Clostridiales bacterium]